MDRPHLSDLRLTGNTESGLVHHDRAWWRVEARRLGSDWPAILRLQVEVVAGWRARHDPDWESVAA